MNFIAKALIKKQLKGVPEQQVDMIIAAIEKDPAFFQTMATKIKALTDAGMNEQEAAQKLLSEHGDDLKKVFGA